jgi:glycosyltransferase involved in cell wall biosynthesis
MSRVGPLAGLRVCHLGHFAPAYSRNRIVRKALTRAGADVVQVVDQRRYAARTPKLIRRGAGARPDVVMVGFPGHADVGAARIVSWFSGSPVILDAFTSLWEAAVSDRQVTHARSLSGLRYRLEDQVACALADLVLLDTQAHCAYFTSELNVSAAKLRVVPVGADDDIMRPQTGPSSDDPFRVLFYGSFIPLHGVEYIIEAGRLLDRAGVPVEISLLGAGQTRTETERLARELAVPNVRFLERRPYEALRGAIVQSHVCLGIFGTTPKASRVIPNKVFDAIACGRPVITRDSPAIREWFSDRKNVWLCPPGDAEALADAIAELRSDQRARERVAEAGLDLFRRQFSLDAMTRRLAVLMREVVPA